MLLAPLALLAAAAAVEPPQAVALVSRFTATTSADAAEKASRIAAILKVPLATPDESPARCEGDRNCLASLGRRLGAAVVIAVDVGLVLDEYALRIEAIDSQQGTLLGAHKSSGPWAAVSPRLETELGPMGYSIVTHLKQLKPAVVPEPVPPPHVEPGPSVVVAKAPSRPLRIAPIALGAGAGAAAIAAAVFTALGLGHKGVIDGLGSPPFPVTRASAEQTAHSASLELNAAIITGALALALAAAAIAFWLGG